MSELEIEIKDSFSKHLAAAGRYLCHAEISEWLGAEELEEKYEEAASTASCSAKKLARLLLDMGAVPDYSAPYPEAPVASMTAAVLLKADVSFERVVLQSLEDAITCAEEASEYAASTILREISCKSFHRLGCFEKQLRRVSEKSNSKKGD